MTRALLAAFALCAAPAWADESWTNPAGTLIYEADLGHIAVLSFPTGATPLAEAGGAPRANVYMPGLGGNFDNRSVHDGYWAMEGAPICTAILTTPDGIATQNWGRARIVFDGPAFPTGFTMLVSPCLDDPIYPVRADLP